MAQTNYPAGAAIGKPEKQMAKSRGQPRNEDKIRVERLARPNEQNGVSNWFFLFGGEVGDGLLC